MAGRLLAVSLWIVQRVIKYASELRVSLGKRQEKKEGLHSLL